RAGTSSYTDTGAAPNILYRYRLRARYGQAVFSEYVEGQVRSAIETPQITAFYAISQSSVYLAWTPTSEASRYQLERKQKGDLSFSVVTATLYDRADFTDSGVIPGGRYAYRVKAISSNRAESLYSDEVEVTVVYIDISYSLTATAVGNYRVELSWSDLGDLESTYEIWRSDQQFPGWKLLDTLPRNSTWYADERVGPGETYTYRVRARSAEYDGNSRPSLEAAATTLFLDAPTGLVQTKFSNTAINLVWIDNSTGESRFVIERRNGPAGQWSQVTYVAANMTEKANLPVTAASAWYFRVGAYSPEYRSIAYSEPIAADNGFETRIRGGGYGGDGTIAAETTAEGGTAAPGGGIAQNGSGGAARDEVRLDADALDTLKRHRIVSVVNGVVSDGGAPVSRGEFVAMLVRALKSDARPIGSFDDVRQGHPYYDEIMMAARMGFARAEFGNLFYPDRAATREELALFVYDSLVVNGTPLPVYGAAALRPFPDAGEAPPASLAQVRAVFGERLMIGIGTSGKALLGLSQGATREEAALVVYRYMLWLDDNG
ncbi:MAG: S-layer homology domain-containing protein, partial [Clostridiales bacterium]|nr:S-layer homology domain-containing protein [Clostridiales bacterium]